jgi:ABC-type transport system substrate-binding protein
VDDYLFGTFYSKSKANYGQVNDPHLDQLILQQRHEVDAAKRTQLVKEAITYLNQHALGLAIQQSSVYEFTAASVQNYAPQFGMHMVPTVDTWLHA